MDAHAQMRRYLSHAFSDRSLTEQEAIISQTIDAWVEGALERGSGPKGFDIGKGYEMMTFDIIGDLAFGETFGGVETGRGFPAHPRRDFATVEALLTRSQMLNTRGSPSLLGRLHKELWPTP